MSEFFQSLDPAGAPGPVTPADSPSDPAGWAQVTPHGQGTAPYSIAAPQDAGGIEAALQAAMGVSGGQEGAGSGAGIPDRHSPRQAEAQALLMSPAGAGAMNVTAGFSPDSDTPNDVSPGATETPVQGTGTYPGTVQGGVQQYGGDDGPAEGLAPEGGSMSTPGGSYPGTTQDGLTKYGTS